VDTAFACRGLNNATTIAAKTTAASTIHTLIATGTIAVFMGPPFYGLALRSVSGAPEYPTLFQKSPQLIRALAAHQCGEFSELG
jgi:hypothetical protein